MAERFATLLLGACMAIGAATARAQDTAAPDAPPPLVWYQLEVLVFARAPDLAPTTETLMSGDMPRWPAGTVALAPVWPEPVRPSTVQELAMLWNGLGAPPRLRTVTPGLTPEIEDLIDWTEQLERRSTAPEPDWESDLDDLDRLAGDLLDEVDALAPVPVPVPAVTLHSAADPIDPDRLPAGAVLAPTDQASTDQASTEQAPASQAPATVANAAGAIIASPPPPGPPEPKDIPIPIELAFRTVAPDQQLLGDAQNRLERAPGVRLLAHLAWRQPFRPDSPGYPVRVLWRNPVSGQADLIGTVRIELRRYLHAYLDLYWRDPTAEGTTEWVHVVQHRRMRSGELHYIDNPRIGTLIQAEPFQLAQPLAPDGPVVTPPRD